MISLISFWVGVLIGAISTSFILENSLVGVVILVVSAIISWFVFLYKICNP